MVYVTHDREEAFDVVTRVVVMKQGRIDHSHCLFTGFRCEGGDV